MAAARARFLHRNASADSMEDASRSLQQNASADSCGPASTQGSNDVGGWGQVDTPDVLRATGSLESFPDDGSDDGASSVVLSSVSGEEDVDLGEDDNDCDANNVPVASPSEDSSCSAAICDPYAVCSPVDDFEDVGTDRMSEHPDNPTVNTDLMSEVANNANMGAERSSSLSEHPGRSMASPVFDGTGENTPDIELVSTLEDLDADAQAEALEPPAKRSCTSSPAKPRIVGGGLTRLAAAAGAAEAETEAKTILAEPTQPVSSAPAVPKPETHAATAAASASPQAISADLATLKRKLAELKGAATQSTVMTEKKGDKIGTPAESMASNGGTKRVFGAPQSSALATKRKLVVDRSKKHQQAVAPPGRPTSAASDVVDAVVQSPEDLGPFEAMFPARPAPTPEVPPVSRPVPTTVSSGSSKAAGAERFRSRMSATFSDDDL